VFHAKVEHLSENWYRKRYDIKEQRMIGVKWGTQHVISIKRWWDKYLNVIRTGEKKILTIMRNQSAVMFVSNFTLHLLSYSVFQHVYILYNDKEYLRGQINGWYNRYNDYYWPLMIADRYDPSRITFTSLTTNKEHVVHICTKKRLKKRKKLSDDVFIIEII